MTTPHPVDGFKINPRIPLEVDLFRQGNPSGRITPDPVEPEVIDLYDGFYAVPYQGGDDRYLEAITRAPLGAGGLWDEHTADQHQPNDLTHDEPHATEPQNETTTDIENTTSTRGKGTIMAGETTITVIGNLTSDPELRFTPSGSAVANFTIASTPRTFDRQANEWKDGETLFLRASVWREAAENVAESLTKGTRVIVSGRLKSRSYETKEGEKRTVIELEVDEIGPSLRYANAKINRTQRTNHGGGNGGGFGNQANTGQPRQQDDPWAANSAANSGSWGNGPDSEPPF
ncbi:single-stranded DNA-binding protein [Paenarthrobacter nitroguajacolicus]|uniref:single-stranded DNA-binding protein n=1 Tax=Paenarthrobacter nitroguajacolicus TaxID=211146 RepID=UPI00248ACFB0|nr:single-stranded DNA-binding protein [Paenarthrobacter nitroguajacolicus]MDI2036842.1 Single-stranded DNA-binding protein [Paenarthrobacter nitroguajacolicus]